MLSYTENIPRILEAVKNSGARRILDVGGGTGLVRSLSIHHIETTL